jgi:hypothetical protein
MDLPLMRSDAMHVRPDGRVSLVRGGVAGLVEVALRRDRDDVMTAIRTQEQQQVLAEIEHRTRRLPREYRDALRDGNVDHTMCLDNPGGDAAVLKILSHALTDADRRGGGSAVFGGLRLESASALIAANARMLITLSDTNILFHAPAWGLEEIGMTEADITSESLRGHQAEQRRNAEVIHAFLGKKVTGFWRNLLLRWKLWRLRRDPANPRGEVAFPAQELPGFVTKTVSGPAALAAAFTERTGVPVQQAVDRPSDRFFTLLTLRQRVIRRLQETLGTGNAIGDPEGGIQITLPHEQMHLTPVANAIVLEEIKNMGLRAYS